MKRLIFKHLANQAQSSQIKQQKTIYCNLIRQFTQKQLCTRIASSFCAQNKTNPLSQTIGLLDKDSELFIENVETRKVNDLVSKGNYKEAIIRCKEILSKEESVDCNRIRYILAYSLKQAGKNKEAIEAFKNFISNMKKSSRQLNQTDNLDTFIEVSHYELALLYQLIGNHLESLNYIEKSLEFNPLYANQQLIESYIFSKKIDRGISFLTKQHERVPQNEPILFLLGFLKEASGDIDGALKEYQKVIDISEEQKHGQANLRAGMILKRKGDFDGSTCFLMRAAESEPQNYSARFNLGQNFRYLGEGALGKENLEACLQLEPNNPLPFYDLALCCEQTGEMEKCIEFLQKNIVFNDTHLDSYLRLANIFSAQNDKLQALKYIKAGINSDDFCSSDQNCHNLIDILIEKTEKNLKEIPPQINDSNSLEKNGEFKQMIKTKYKELEEQLVQNNRSSKRNQVLNMLTQLFIMSGEIELGIETTKRLVELEQNVLQNRVNLASMYRSQKEYTSAIEQFDKLILIEPQQPEYHYFKAQLSLQAGLIQEAIKSYTLSIRLQGENDYSLFELSHCYKISNELEKQKTCIDTLLKYFPDFYTEEASHIQFIQSLPN